MKKYHFPCAAVIALLTCFTHNKIFSQDWRINGNAGTNSSTNFIGTTDNKDLSFRTNNSTRMRISSGGNIGIGLTAPLQKLDVNGNINIGKGFSLYMENQRVLKIDSVNQNTFLGNRVAINNTTGFSNTANGYQALYANTTGAYNTASGTNALASNTTGGYNSAAGGYALYNNTTGSYNNAQGYLALYSNIDGAFNTAAGNWALYNNIASYNTATGYTALYSNTTGSSNTAHGYGALYSNSTGLYNTAVGYGALYYSSASNYNTALGYLSGDSYRNGWNNVFIGANTDANGPDFYNVIAIGQGTICTDVSQARIGNYATTSIGGYANWTNISDVRVKKNMKENVPGLAFINKLKPITYNLDLEAADKIIQPPVRKDIDGKVIQPAQQELDSKKAKEQVIYTGFAAQDVEKAAKELNYDFSGVDAAKNSKSLYGLRYAEFVVPLVKAVQELSKDNDDLRKTNNDLQQRLERIESMMDVKSSDMSSIKQQVMSVSDASLQQNIPNPFNRATTINYSLPQQYHAAKIVITDKSGKTLKEMNVTGNGKSSIVFDASALASGTYQYSLYADGKLISTKQMVHAK